MLVLAAWTAAAEEEEHVTLAQDASIWIETLIDSQEDYRTLNLTRGTRYAVYSAPYADAWRGANGKAAVSVSEPFQLLGTADHGNWLWVYYRIDKQSGRVGWVYAPEAANEVYDVFPNDNNLLILRDDNVPVTDDPFGSRRVIATLKAGDEIIGLGSLGNEDGENEWLYIEMEIDGRPAWGFIRDAQVAEAPLYSVEDGVLVIREGVTRIGYIPHDYDYDEDTGWMEKMEMDFNQMRGDIAITSEIDLWELGAGEIESVSLPSTLRILGSYGFVFGHLREFRVPDKVERIESYAFYGTDIDRFILSAGFTGEIAPDMLADRCGAAEFAVEEGSPRYASRDGVLFSADMKTLILYPARKTAAHYDVPRGVEIIGDYAFFDDEMDNPLQTVSLPIGLKEIGYVAFGGCGRLHSISIPLTVTRVDESAFKNCVSLERVSAPPGIEIALPSDSGWAEAVDQTYYMGDNGFTGWNERESRYGMSFSGWITAPAGEETAPVYEDDEDGQMQAVERIAVGTYLYASYSPRVLHDGFTRFRPADSYTWHWISMDNILRDPGDIYFTISDGAFASGKYESSRGFIADSADYAFSGLGEEAPDMASFDRFILAYEDGYPYQDYDSVDVPVRECTLYRRDGDGNAVLGILVSSGDSPAVWLRDEIGGEPVLCLFPPYQCKVTEVNGDWLRVHTIAGDGWIPRDNFREVYPKE